MSTSTTTVRGQQVVLILVGLVASGKSTFAQALEAHVPYFRRCNQDDLGNRRQVEALARRSLREGLSVCIDRTNFDEQQRSTWINIAREVPGTATWILVFDTPYEICAERLRSRLDHPTIKSLEDGLPILARFRSQYRPPRPHEGYSKILYLGLREQNPHYTRDGVLAILQRLRDTPATVSSYTPHTGSRDRQGRGRGRGYGWRGQFETRDQHHRRLEHSVSRPYPRSSRGDERAQWDRFANYQPGAVARGRRTPQSDGP